MSLKKEPRTGDFHASFSSFDNFFLTQRNSADCSFQEIFDKIIQRKRINRKETPKIEAEERPELNMSREGVLALLSEKVKLQHIGCDATS